jgi:hypothetical protein
MSAAIFFFVVTGIAGWPAVQSTKLGPLSQEQCIKLKRALPELPGECRKVVSLMACGLDGRPGTYTVCPIFEGEIEQVGK